MISLRRRIIYALKTGSLDVYPERTWVSFHRLRLLPDGTEAYSGFEQGVLHPRRFGLRIDAYAEAIYESVEVGLAVAAEDQILDGPATPIDILERVVDELLEALEEGRKRLDRGARARAS